MGSMQSDTNSSLKTKIMKGMKEFIKRILPPGSLGRRIYYQLRARYGRSIISLDRRPALPIDQDLQQFLNRLEERQNTEVVVFLASTVLDESEGQRSTNLALEFSERGVPCVFGYWRWKRDFWAPQDRLEDGILQIPVDVLASWPEMIFREIKVTRKILLVEFPHPSFFKLIAEAHASGWTIIYDVVDDWEEFFRVGQAIWYDSDFEKYLLHSADAVVTVNRFLADHLGRSPVSILPNGLSCGVEVIDQERTLERGEITVGYFGYLAGAWFDWELLAEAARLQPKWKFYLIGYGGSPEGTQLPDNLHLLGKQPRRELAAYAANWDVAIIPFKEERLARGADPIKTYEYLAMGLPVVVTGVFPPEGAEPYVQRAQGVEGFIQALRIASEDRDREDWGREDRERNVEERKAFAQTCTWSNRVDDLLKLVESGSQRIGEKQAMFGGKR
jgi:glycosyltransferase involved in cell wall biosynthesis